LQTFKVESALFNIRMSTADKVFRTVMLKKKQVEIDGETKLIIMINDVSARVKLK